MVYDLKGTQLHDDMLMIQARAGSFNSSLPRSMSAIQTGMEVVACICTLAADAQALREENVRKAISDMFDSVEDWLQAQRQFEANMEKVARTLFSNPSSER